MWARRTRRHSYAWCHVFGPIIPGLAWQEHNAQCVVERFIVGWSIEHANTHLHSIYASAVIYDRTSQSEDVINRWVAMSRLKTICTRCSFSYCAAPNDNDIIRQNSEPRCQWMRYGGSQKWKVLQQTGNRRTVPFHQPYGATQTTQSLMNCVLMKFLLHSCAEIKMLGFCIRIKRRTVNALSIVPLSIECFVPVVPCRCSSHSNAFRWLFWHFFAHSALHCKMGVSESVIK